MLSIAILEINTISCRVLNLGDFTERREGFFSPVTKVNSINTTCIDGESCLKSFLILKGAI
jgi:hypothetical protein